jgi:hypothetical protein
MADRTGPGTEARCRSLLTAATNHEATPGDVAALFPNQPPANVNMAIHQLSLAGVLAS